MKKDLPRFLPSIALNYVCRIFGANFSDYRTEPFKNMVVAFTSGSVAAMNRQRCRAPRRSRAIMADLSVRAIR